MSNFETCPTLGTARTPKDSDERLGVEVGVYGGANDIPPHIWSTEADVSSETVVRLLGQITNELRRTHIGVPGMMPPQE